MIAWKNVYLEIEEHVLREKSYHKTLKLSCIVLYDMLRETTIYEYLHT